MPHSLDLRPASLPGVFRPGDSFAIELTGPAGWLSSRAFTATFGAASLTVAEAGDVLTVSASSAQTTGLTAIQTLVITETGGNDWIVGPWAPKLAGTTSHTHEVTVTYGPAEVTLEVLTGPHADVTALDARVDALEAFQVAKASRTSGAMTLAVAASWTDFDPTGNASARDLDVILTNMRVGDFFDFKPFLSMAGAAGTFCGNVAVYNEGVVQRRFYSSSFGNQFWLGATTSGLNVTAVTERQTVLAGDLEDEVDGVGNLRLRFQYTKSSATNAIAGSADFPVTFEGRGPFV